MDAQGDGVSSTDAETITDIQNYLASFNKEIQDGTTTASSGGAGDVQGSIADVSGGTVHAEGGEEGTTTYYVTQTADGTQIENYQYGEQNQAHFEGGTFYASSDAATYYASGTAGTHEEGIGTYQAAGDETTPSIANVKTEVTDPSDVESGDPLLEGMSVGDQQQPVRVTIRQAGGTYTAVQTGSRNDQLQQDAAQGAEHAGLQQIVLAVSEAQNMPSGELLENEPREISVTIPASMATQVGSLHDGNHEATEELLQAVENHAGSTEGSHTSNQPTFVAMQPGSSHDGVVSSSDQQVVTVNNGDQGLAALITQAESIQGQAGSERIVAHHGGHTQTIRMVVRQADGTETEQTIPVSAAAADGSTLVTSDGQEIHVGDDGTLQMMANLAEQAAAGEGNNQVILNTGSSYQTVTIVPSDTNPGEVSYVLIVSQPEDGKDGVQKGMNLDMSVYDFNEGEKHGEVISEETTPDGTKMRTIKISPKKSQTVTQAHMCNYCNYTSPKRYLLSRHMKSHSEERPHKCSVCERGFKTLASLQNHVNTHTGTRPHQCKECDAAFTTSGELVRHVRYKHTHEKPHRCTECDYASVELSKLKRHMRCHTGERPYQCPHCTYASPDTYKLKRHLRIHTGEKPYECNVCHARFTQSNSLKAHKLIHSGNKPIFQCELCPTTCGRKTDLRIHVQKLHTSDKPLKCKRCGKSFPDRYTYKVHVKTHEGEKCFKCDLCPYASISQRHLESHMLIHTDQKPFHCDECDQSFRQKQLLKRHKNLYHNPDYVPPVPKEKTHECPECQKAFRHKGNLIRHLAVHDPDASAAEKAEAMRIGQPKGPGERLDGEEDDYEEEEDELEGLSMDAAAIDTSDHNGQQVVVFEVIQLPAGDGSSDVQAAHVAQSAAMAMAAATGESHQGVTIIQQVANSLADEVAAAVAKVHGSENVLTEMITPNRTSGDQGTISKGPQSGLITIEPPPPTPRRRGRPRKVVPLPVELTEAITLTPGKDGDNENVEDPIVPEPRYVRRRKTDDGDDSGEAKRVRVTRAFRGKVIKEEVIDPTECDSSGFQPDMVAVAADPEELARREADLVRRRLEQKKKDMAECFGFNDDEDDETILAMPAAPGVHPVNVNGDELSTKVSREDSGDAETALHLLNSMHQNGAGDVHMDTT